MGNKKNKRSHTKLPPWAHRKWMIEKCAAMIRRKATSVIQTELKPISSDHNTTTALWLMKMQQPSSDTPKPYVRARHFDEKYINMNTSCKRLRKADVPTRDLPTVSQDPDGMIDRDEASHSCNTSPAEGLDTCLVPVKVEQMDNDPSTSSSDIKETLRKGNPSEKFQYEVPTKIVKIKEENQCLTVFVDEDKADGHHEHEIIANQYIYDITLVNPTSII